MRPGDGGPTAGAPRSRTSWGRVLETLKARPVLGSASTVLAALTPLDVRADVPGATDMAMALAAAAASAFAGDLVGAFGYPALAAHAAVPACLAVAAGLSVVRRGHAEPHVA